MNNLGFKEQVLGLREEVLNTTIEQSWKLHPIIPRKESFANGKEKKSAQRLLSMQTISDSKNKFSDSENKF